MLSERIDHSAQRMNINPSLIATKPFTFKPRSFVHRQNGLNPQRQEALKTLLPIYSLPINQPLKLNQHFQHTAPITLEIGFGMGQHLLAQAQKHPYQNFLGIDVYRPGIAALLLGINRLKLSNLKIIHADAVEAIASSIPNHSLHTIQIFFPDPWPKKRHHKRRLIQLEFTTLLQKKLVPNGQLQLATDWQDYAEQMLLVLENTPGLKNNAGKNKFSPKLPQRYPTKFEQRGKQLGHTIWDLLFYATP